MCSCLNGNNFAEKVIKEGLPQQRTALFVMVGCDFSNGNSQLFFSSHVEVWRLRKGFCKQLQQ